MPGCRWWRSAPSRSVGPLPLGVTVAYSRRGRRGVSTLTHDEATSSSRYLTVREVAGTLRVSNMTVYRLINAGELPALRIGKSFRLRQEDVDGYLATRYTQAG